MFAELPAERTLDLDPPACCPDLTGGWQFARVVFPGDEATATLSSPGPDPVNPPRVDVNPEVVFRLRRVTARGEPLRVVREKRVRVDTVEAMSKPFLTVEMPDPAPAYYALELALHPDSGRTERYVSYTYVSPPGEPAVDLEWEWINHEDAFIALGKVVEPRGREREEIRLSGGLDPGRYRIVKSFRAPPGDRELSASVEFTVR